MRTSELIKILRKNGCRLYRHGSNHDTWISDRTGKKFVVPRHLSKEIPSGTLQKILKDAGLN